MNRTGRRKGTARCFDMLAASCFGAVVLLFSCSTDIPVSSDEGHAAFSLLENDVTNYVWSIEGNRAPAHIDGFGLPFSYTDTTMDVWWTDYRINDSTVLVLANTWHHKGLTQGVLSADSQFTSIPARWSPYSPRFERHGVGDNMTVTEILDDGSLEMRFRDSSFVLAEGDTFAVVDTVIDTAYATYYNDGVWSVDSSTIWWITGHCQTTVYRNVGRIKHSNVVYHE